MKATENQVKTSIINWLVYHGWLVIRVNSGAVSANHTDKRGQTRKRFFEFAKWFTLGNDPQSAGVSDILALKEGFKPLAIECKLPGKGPTSKQADFLNAWVSHGGLRIVANSIDDVQAALEEIE